MTTDESDGDTALESLRWQDEILQAMYWLRGEGLAEVVSSIDLARLLGAAGCVVGRQLGRLAARGYVERAPGRPPRYRLTEKGRVEGARSFRDEFAELTRPAHGECAEDCWCYDPTHLGEPCPHHAGVASPAG